MMMTGLGGHLLANTIDTASAREPNPLFRLWKLELAAKLRGRPVQKPGLDSGILGMCADLMAFYFEQGRNAPFVSAAGATLIDLRASLPVLWPYLAPAYLLASRRAPADDEFDNPDQIAALNRYLDRICGDIEPGDGEGRSCVADDGRPYGFAWEPRMAKPRLTTVFFRHRPESLCEDVYWKALADRINRMVRLENEEWAATLLARVTAREGLQFQRDLSDAGQVITRYSAALADWTSFVFYPCYEEDIAHDADALRWMLDGEDTLERFIASLYEDWD